MVQNRTPAAWRGNGGWLAKAVVENRPLSNKPKRARQDDVIQPPRERRHANQAAMRRWEKARAFTVAAFEDHRGTRLALSFMRHPTVPPTRGAP
jgi:hypothetical protein